MITCPYCNKESNNDKICEFCGGDLIFAKENNILSQQNNNLNFKGNGNKFVNDSKPKNPALQEVERRLWVKNSTLPDWIKEKILSDSNKNSKRG